MEIVNSNSNIVSTTFRGWHKIKKKEKMGRDLKISLVVAQPVEKFPLLLEPESSIPRSQGPASGPCPEPDESSTRHPLCKIQFNSQNVGSNSLFYRPIIGVVTDFYS